jgi:hypothetical protein
VALAETRERLGEPGTTGLADDVSDEQESHPRHPSRVGGADGRRGAVVAVN